MLKKRGAALLTVIITMSAVFLLAIIVLNGQIRSTKDLKYVKSDTQANYCAESGANYAMAQRIRDIKAKFNSYNFSNTYNSASDAIPDINKAVNLFLAEISKPSDVYNDNNLFNDSNAGYEQASTKVNKIYTVLKSDGTAALVPASNGNYNFDINSSNGKIYVLYDVNSKGYYSYGDKIYYSLKGQFKISIQVSYNTSTNVSDHSETSVTVTLTIALNDKDNDYKIYNKNTGTTN